MRLSVLPAVCNPRRHQPGLFQGARKQPRVNKSTPRVSSTGPGEAHPQGSGFPGGPLLSLSPAKLPERKGGRGVWRKYEYFLK